MKSFKKMMKNCLAMQCTHCNKWIQASSFTSHLYQCVGGDSVKDMDLDNSNLKESSFNAISEANLVSSMGLGSSQSLYQLHISVSQHTVMKDLEENKKPYTEYIVQMAFGDHKWKVSKRYKQFSELQQVTND